MYYNEKNKNKNIKKEKETKRKRLSKFHLLIVSYPYLFPERDEGAFLCVLDFKSPSI